MRLLDPETFKDQPYVAGLNQGGHMIAGAAIFAGAFALLGGDWGLVLALVIPLVLEAWQYLARDAAGWDCVLDYFFWQIGATAWVLAVMMDDVSGFAILLPVWSVLIMGAVMAVFTIFKARSKGDL
ncbi:hypothetical protein [Roseobacter sp. OBYS 0001]|uniref:hypothetical protein n=1 Tax=Roseobacter sp. OBYS 0001 TaxID=882651 RepID=UPI001BBE9B9F|nr:hypothetical protein [Roseobacter sp. OBYS 0001]GIT85395.1 hypothetical protein ROBYS_04110 [Roseobacter sp. OBYS 0001]